MSESVFTVRGHGVHSVYEESLHAIKRMPDIRKVSGLRAYRKDVILHVHTMGPFAALRMMAHRGPRLISAHVTPETLIGSIKGAHLVRGLVNRYMRGVFDLATLVLSVSKATTAELEELGVRRPVVLMSNAVDDRRIRAFAGRRAELRREFGWDERLVVLGVGQVQPRKGVEEFVACARRLPHLRFVWVGGMQFGMLSDARHDLARLRETAPENVTFTGLVPREEVFARCAAADVFFLPSKHETFGLATLEAATAALPVVVPDLPCYRDWLKDAYLHARTVPEFTELLRGLEDPQVRATWARLASSAAAAYDSGALADGLRDAYRQAATHHRADSPQKMPPAR
ncbi:glycosyl transferase [Sphaerisporangium melleum]|uniref:Glycosyl transferase n=1 Tax=Sphaerisporangium melleum TaxID=321316 RepID=A0A917VTQ0_9ACTN|nr:glycosyltransferase [Sphaerisporangium melleum]GGL13600.1 glycosyl transferase [Sphaerisporangium melleum]GII74521.1 glycosyl transferase [Sphaerisporangium melleum]